MVDVVNGKMVGLIVDSASEDLKIPHSEIEHPPNVFEEGELNYVTGVGKLNGRLILLVDLTKILQLGELPRGAEFTEADPRPAPAAAAPPRNPPRRLLRTTTTLPIHTPIQTTP